MTAAIIDGKALAADVRAEVARRVKALAGKGVVPGLDVVLVGDDVASATYVRNKERFAKEVGMRGATLRLPATASQDEVEAVVRRLNADPATHGILVQLPLPRGLDGDRAVGLVDPAKDVDGFHPLNQGLLLQGRPRFAPATPAGVVELLRRTGHPVAGKRVVVLGRSNIVGRPLAALLLAKGAWGDATVTVAHSRTPDVAAVAREADVLVAAIGRPRYVTADMVKPGAVVIDVGMNRAPEGGLCGDVDFEAVRKVASAITPVPGGVGPMTIAMLLQNTVLAAERSLGA